MAFLTHKIDAVPPQISPQDDEHPSYPLPDGSYPAHMVAGATSTVHEFNNPGGALAYLEAHPYIETRPPLAYMTDCPTLPATRPPGFPHIIDLARDKFHTDETDLSDLTCADAAATFLWKWDQEQFHRFFNLEGVREVEIHYEVPNNSKGLDDIVIKRVRDDVTISWRLAGNDENLMYVVQADGSWKAISSLAQERGPVIWSNPVLLRGFGRDFAMVVLSGELLLLELEGVEITVVK